MKVKNIKGTAGRSCDCLTWIQHWRNYNKGQTATTCKAKGCKKKKIVGAHVKKRGGGEKEFIVPLCDDHNKQKTPKWIELRKGTKCAPANKNKTCKK